MEEQHGPLVVAGLAVVVYLNTLSYGFVFDDLIEVVRNTHIRSLRNLPQIFASTAWAGGFFENHLYRPLTNASFALNHAVSGLSPWSYHLVNVALHALVSVLLFRTARGWGLAPLAAGLAAALFAVHPLHVEVVAGVAGRKDLLMTAFALATLLAHRRARRDGGGWLWAAPLSYAAAMFAKEPGALVLGLVAMADGLAPGAEPPRRSQRRRRAVLYGAYGVSLLVFAGARTLVVRGFDVPDIPFIDNPAAHAAAGVRVLTAVTLVGRGMALLVVPFTLSPDYSFDAIGLTESPADPRLLTAAAALCALAIGAWRARRRAPLLLFCLGGYALTLLPGSNLLFPIGTLFADRLLYLPSLFFALAAGRLAQAAAARPRPTALYGAALVVLLALGARTVSYAAQWRDDLTLFSAAVAAVPRSTKAQLLLGESLARRGRKQEAAAAYTRALDIAPGNFRARAALAGIHRELGRLDQARRLYEGALADHPGLADALHGLGLLHQMRGDLAGARELWQRALRGDPNHAPSLGDLGTLHFLAGELDQAQARWERSVAVDPTLATAWFNLGLLYQRTGQLPRARAAYQRFLQLAEGEPFAAQRARAQQALGQLPR